MIITNRWSLETSDLKLGHQATLASASACDRWVVFIPGDEAPDCWFCVQGNVWNITWLECIYPAACVAADPVTEEVDEENIQNITQWIAL